MKKGIRILIILLILAAGVYAFLQYQKEKDTQANEPLTIYGSIDIRDAALVFPEQERIAEILVEEGMKVKQGQVLARQRTERINASIAKLEATIAQQQEVVKQMVNGNRPQEIEQSRAEVEAARARVKNAKLKLSRLNNTSKIGATSLQTLDDAISQLKIEKAQLNVSEKALNLMLEGTRQEEISAAKHKLDALQAERSLLNVRLKDMTLLAPSTGVIQSRILEVGEMAGPSKPVATLALIDPKWVRAYVPEPMLGKIQQGMKTEVFNDSFPGIPINGWVGYISSVAEFTPRTVETEDLRTKLVYETRIFVDDPQNHLRLGMPVTVKVNEQEFIEPNKAPTD